MRRSVQMVFQDANGWTAIRLSKQPWRRPSTGARGHARTATRQPISAFLERERRTAWSQPGAQHRLRRYGQCQRSARSLGRRHLHHRRPPTKRRLRTDPRRRPRRRRRSDRTRHPPAYNSGAKELWETARRQGFNFDVCCLEQDRATGW